MLSGWKRLSFRANSFFIDRARNLCENHITENLMMNIFVLQWKFILKLRMVKILKP